MDPKEIDLDVNFGTPLGNRKHKRLDVTDAERESAIESPTMDVRLMLRGLRA